MLSGKLMTLGLICLLIFSLNAKSHGAETGRPFYGNRLMIGLSLGQGNIKTGKEFLYVAPIEKQAVFLGGYCEFFAVPPVHNLSFEIGFSVHSKMDGFNGPLKSSQLEYAYSAANWHFAVSPQWYFYAGIGLAWVELENNYIGGSGPESTWTQFVPRVSAGVKYQMDSRIRLRFSSEAIPNTSLTSEDTYNRFINEELDFQYYAITFGIDYGF